MNQFFLLTFLISWGAWAMLILLGADDLDLASPLTLLFLLGGFGPTLAGLALTAISEGREGLATLWRRTFEVQFGLRWYLVIFLLFPAVNVLAIAIWRAGGVSLLDLSLTLSLMGSTGALIPMLFLSFITGALAEEYGWRGYALDRLQAKWDAAISSFALGALWAIWHLPLFLMRGAPQSASGVSFLLFAAWIVVLSPIYTWVYNGTGQSLAAVLLLHWVSTITGSLLPTAQSETIGLAIVSSVIMLWWLRRAAPARKAATQPPSY